MTDTRAASTMPLAAAESAPPYRAAGVVTLLLLLVYVVTLAPTTQFWDTSEYIAAAKVLGIPHPPGNPLFVIIAHVWAMLPLAAHYALRINLLAATTSALAAGFLFLVADRMLASTTSLPRWLRWLTAGAGTLVGATSFTVWNQATVNEKTYTISVLSITGIMWLALRWADRVATAPPGTGGQAATTRSSDRYLILIAYLLALTNGNHEMGLLAGPLVAVYLVWTEPSALLRWRLWAAVLVVAIVGSTIWVFLPIRAAHFPPINEGEPTTWAAFRDVLERVQYQKPPLSVRQADFLSQLGMYVQYYGWQYAKDWSGAAREFLAGLFGLLALTGAVRQWLRDRRGAVAMTLLMFTITVALVYYLDFKYGYSYHPGEHLPREVRERDYFFVASFLLWGIWIAIGLGTVVETVADWVGARVADARRWRLGAPLLVVAIIPLLGNHISASRAGETFPRDMAIDLLQSVEPYGILITAGDNDTFPLWYAQEVEGVRQDVIIANQSLMNTDWHLRQINRRPVFPFDSADAIAPYRGRSWPAPTTTPFALSNAQLDALPEEYPLSRPTVFQVESLKVTLPATDLLRSDLATLQLIRDNLGKRPIYFSRTTGGYADEMGFTPYLLGQGLVRQLMPTPIAAAPTVVYDRRLGWMDMQRTQTLLFDVYHAQSAARQRPLGWIDRPSESMLVVYGLTYAVWGDLAAKDSAATMRTLAGRADSLATRIFANTSYGASLLR
jgi:Protein O-mannosyl-transferase TMEM260-like